MMGGGFGGSVLALVPADDRRRRSATPSPRRSPAMAGRRRGSSTQSPRRCPAPGLQSRRDRDPEARITMPVRDDARRRSRARSPSCGRRSTASPRSGCDLPADPGQGARRAGRAAAGGQHRAGAQLGDRGAARRAGGRAAAAVLLRGDMDALPVTEETGLDVRLADRRRHARLRPRPAHGHAGRGGPAAGGAAARACPARWCSCSSPARRATAGARHMISEGVLDAAGERPVAAYAPARDVGRTARAGCSRTRPGPMLAAADELEVTVRGRGGHASPAAPTPPTRSRPPARW